MPHSLNILFERFSTILSSLYPSIEEYGEDSAKDHFHKQFFDKHFCNGFDVNMHWMGVPVEKCPLDLWIYQEILWEIKPDLIIETGTGRGGTTLYLACLLDQLHNGHIVSIDSGEMPSRPAHNRISYLIGNSVSATVVEEVSKQAANTGSVMVILDSEHSKNHVLNEIYNYAPLVTKGSYLIVEDTHFNGNPVPEEIGPGPYEAVDEYLASTTEFQPNRMCEKFQLTFNPKGYLQKVD